MDNIVPENDLPVVDTQVVSRAVPTNDLPDQDLQSQANNDLAEYEQKQVTHGNPLQQSIAGVEKFAKDSTFGASTAAEVALGVNPEDIKAREEANPGTAALGSIAALLTPGGLENKALTAAGKAVGSRIIGEGVVAGASRMAAKMATENALYQVGDEVHKKILNPELGVQSALSHITLGAAIGAVSGGVIGAASPLWNATFKPKADGVLNLLRNKADGVGINVDTSFDSFLKNAEKDGTPIAPEIRSALSNNPHLQNMFKQLRDNGLTSGEALTELTKQTKDIANKQIESLVGAGGPTAQEAGELAKQSLLSKAEDLNKSVKEKYSALGDVTAVAIPDEARLKSYDQLIESGQNFGAVGSPQSNLFKAYGERMLSQNTVGQLDKLNTEIGGELSKAWRAGDTETYKALANIRDHIRDFQDHQIGKAVEEVAKPLPMTDAQKSLYGNVSKEYTEGATEATDIASQVVAERKAARSAYHDFMTNLTEMASLGKVGKVKNYSQFEEAIQNIPAMKLSQKLFDPKNLEKLNKLKSEYPDIFEKIVQQQKSDIIESASKSGFLNHNTVMNKINSLPKEVRGLMFKPEDLKSIESASSVISHLSSRLNPSGTAGTLNKLWQHIPAGIGALVGAVTGHGAMSGAVVGELTSFLGTGAPNIAKMAALKFLGSEAPVSSGALKSAFDFLNMAYKGQKASDSAIKSLFKSGTKVLPDAMIPDDKSRKKIEKSLAELTLDPSKLVGVGGDIGHYLPDHQVALASTIQNITSFLNSIKPSNPPKAILNPEIPVNKAVQAQYNRALDIAQQPLIVLHSVKDGTINSNDIKGLQVMYPALYQSLRSDVMSELVDRVAKEDVIPYKTRLGLSMFLGQPLDSSFTAESIAMAQPETQQDTAQSINKGSNQAQDSSLTQGAASTMAKGAKTARTPGQASEAMHTTGDA